MFVDPLLLNIHLSDVSFQNIVTLLPEPVLSTSTLELFGAAPPPTFKYNVFVVIYESVCVAELKLPITFNAPVTFKSPVTCELPAMFEITGEVNVLFVSVCEPVSVATVLSIAIVPPLYVIPVPPVSSASTLAPTAVLKSVICELGIAMATSAAASNCPLLFTV